MDFKTKNLIMSHIPQRKSTILKYQRIQERYKELYVKKRIRRDDCIKMVMDEFFINHEETVYRILGTDISDQLEAIGIKKVPKKVAVKPKIKMQYNLVRLSMF